MRHVCLRTEPSHHSFCVLLLTCMCEGPGTVNKHNVCRQQHYDDAMGQGDQAAVALGPSVREGGAEQQVEAQPANQAADHLQ